MLAYTSQTPNALSGLTTLQLARYFEILLFIIPSAVRCPQKRGGGSRPASGGTGVERKEEDRSEFINRFDRVSNR